MERNRIMDSSNSQTSDSQTTEALADLIVINNDRIEGYGRASEEAKETDLKSLFSDMVSHSREFKRELTTELLRLGARGVDGTRTSGEVFRAWMDVKAALTGNDRKTILNSCVQGENAALGVYDGVLESDSSVSDPLRATIARQRDRIQQDQARIKSLLEAPRT